MSMMWFITLDNTCLDYPRLSAPNYRHIGSLTRAEANPLKGELKAFVDGANDGMILITFGTTTPGIKTLRHFIPMFRKIAPEIRQTVVLQLSIDDDPGEFPSNNRFERWVPQNDILGHSNTVVFVSHGGANGQMKATYHGVPQICIGIMEEQKYNCRRMVEHHYGLSLSLDTLSAENFLPALSQITKNPSYKGNVSHCSRIRRSLPVGQTAASILGRPPPGIWGWPLAPEFCWYAVLLALHARYSSDCSSPLGLGCGWASSLPKVYVQMREEDHIKGQRRLISQPSYQKHKSAKLLKCFYV